MTAIWQCALSNSPPTKTMAGPAPCRRLATARLAALAAPALAALFTLPAVAQTITLVSNTSETDTTHLSISNRSVAQGFTTGSETLGYELHEVTMKLAVPSNPTAPPVDIVQGAPDGTVVATLSPPNPFPRASGDIFSIVNATYTLPTVITLLPTTTYYVRWNKNDNDNTGVRLAASDSDTGLSGWSLANAAKQTTANTAQTWFDISSGTSAVIAVKGKIATPPGAPDASTSLSATASGTTRIDLSWTAPANDGGRTITGYKIEWSAGGNAPWNELVASTGSRDTTYSDTGLQPGQTRHYRVSAINSLGTGAVSNVASATTPTSSPLVLNTNVGDVRSISFANRGLAQGFKAGTNALGYTLSGAVIRARLNAGSRTYPTVKIISGSSPNGTVTATLEAPTGSLEGTTGTYTNISYTAPSGITLLSETGYFVRIDKGDHGWNVATHASNDQTGEPGWRVADRHMQTPEDGDGTVWMNATTTHSLLIAINGHLKSNTVATAPAAPTSLSATASGTTRIDLLWTAPANDGGGDITGYKIEWSADGNAPWNELVADTGSTTTTYNNTGLQPGQTRHYRVSAINSAGTGTPSSGASATTGADAPDAPTSLSATANGTTRIDLSWTAPADDGGGDITGYKIEWSADGNAPWNELVADTGSTTTTYNNTGLQPGQTRHYRVSAINSAGTGTPSSGASATTDADAPDAPTSLSATANGTTRIDLSWTAPVDDGGADITGYKIEWSAHGNAPWNELVADTGSTTTTYNNNTGLQPGQTRHYRVSAINSAGTGTPSSAASATTDADAPDAPTSLSATANGTTRIDLSWTAPADDGGGDITGYKIEWSADGNAPWNELVADTGSTTTTYNNTGLQPGQTRHYQVSAINSAGTGTPSSAASATTDANAPDAPTSLSATANGTTRIDLSWTAPADDGGGDITGYKIEWSADGNAPWNELVADTGSTTTTYNNTGLQPGQTRHYQVSAINSAGTGTPSSAASATTDANAPDAPTSLSATANGTTRIDLSWTAPADDGGADITGYNIEWSADGNAPWNELVADTGSTTTTYNNTGLQPGQTRHYQVSAINSAGTGAPSSAASATTDANAPDAPTSLSATANGTTRIDLSWTAPADDGGADITGYKIEWSADGNAPWNELVADTGSTTTTYNNTGLQPGQTRHYRVSAINSAGTGVPSSAASATTDAVAPDAPTSLSATASGNTRIDLLWTAPANDGGADITGYKIEWSADGNAPRADLVADTGSTTTSYSNTGLQPGDTRHYRVSAINSAGTGSPSSAASTTTDANAPDAPTSLSATANGTTRIDLSWTAPADDGGADITGYNIEWSADGNAPWNELVADTGSTTTTYNNTGLQPGQTRHYRVSAINSAGTGVPSSAASATTDAVAPDAPTSLSATASGNTRIDLLWTAPANDGGGDITGYNIEWSADGNAPWNELVADTGSTTTTYNNTGLQPGQTRHCRVSAINSVGTGPPSSAASATTDADAPDAPTSLSAAASGTTRIDLSWTAPADDGGADITGYKIEWSADGNAPWNDLVADTGSTTTSYSNTGLQPGQTRHYRVSAINSAATGAPSSGASATTDAVAPDAPTSLSATASGNTRIDLLWTAPANDGGADISGYKIEWSADGNAPWNDLVANTGSPTTSHSTTGLQPGQTRHCRVSAINSAGTGPPSSAASATTPNLLKASFTVDVDCPDDLCRALTGEAVRFFDTSTGAVRTRRWSFGDDRRATSTTASRAWGEPGFYTVTLTVAGGDEESTASRTFLVEASIPAGTCTADRETLCLRHSRFAVRIDWWLPDGTTGNGTVVREGTNDSGMFWFFDTANWETLIKVLDGCEVNGRVWVFGATTTDLGYRIEVTDTGTGEIREYRNEPGAPAPAITDVAAFADSCEP